MLIYLIRHAPVSMPEGTCYGSTDVSLASDWEEQLELIRSKLPLEAIGEDNLYSSPLKRCTMLAHGLSPSPRFDDRLKEMDYGEWEGKPWSDIPRSETQAWLSDLENVRTPKGESLGDVYQRGVACLSEIAARSHDSAFIMTHGALIRCLVAYAVGLPLGNAARVQIDYASICRLRLEGERKSLECMNV